MKRHDFLHTAALGGASLALLPLLQRCGVATRRPNIVVILADDLGYGDVACLNDESKIPTPHIDRLASGGIRLTDAHSPSGVCTPTRYGLLTGRYAWHFQREPHLGACWLYPTPSDPLPDSRQYHSNPCFNSRGSYLQILSPPPTAGQRPQGAVLWKNSHLAT